MEHVVLKSVGSGRVALTLPVSNVQFGSGSKTLQQVKELPSNFSSARIFKLPPGVVLVKPTIGTVGSPVVSNQPCPVIRLGSPKIVPIQPKPPPRIIPNPAYKPEPVTSKCQAQVVNKKPPVVHNAAKSQDEDSLKENKQISSIVNKTVNRSVNDGSVSVTSCGSSVGNDQNSRPKPKPWGRDPRPLWKSKEPIVMYSGCSKEDLQEAEKRKRKKEFPPASLPCPKILEDILPKSYRYHIFSFEGLENPEHFKAEIRTTITKKDEALQWLKDFEAASGTNFRITKTFKENSFRIVFKKCYKCHKNTFRKGQQQSKRHLGCQARLSITVKNTGMKSSADPLLSEFPCVIGIHHNHCHSLTTPDALRHRRTLPEVREKFADMFRAKITPAAALRVHKADLKREYGDKYEEAINDGAKCPPLPWCYRLYYEICGKKVKDGKKKSTRRSYSSSKKKVVVRQTMQNSFPSHSANSVLADFNPENCLSEQYAMENLKSKPDDEMQRSINSLYGYEFMSKSNLVGDEVLSKGVSSNRTDMLVGNSELVETSGNTEILNSHEVLYRNDSGGNYEEPSTILDDDDQDHDNVGFEETCDILDQDTQSNEENRTVESTKGNMSECSISELKQGLHDFYNHLLNKMRNNPELFIPAVETFISTANSVSKTGSDFELAEKLYNFSKTMSESANQVTPELTHAVAPPSSNISKAQKHKLLESHSEVSTLVEGLLEQSQSSSIIGGTPETSGSPPKRKVLVLRMKPNKFHQILGKVEENRLKKGS
ncbi:hypothetical protein FOCC_FOCC015815 [Frankliniella occidentalis]|uniref:Uncharacterized protein LOC113207032 n=1 Tax=Frankliniella occidentalis TaxID=133901 RepID=A0A6J1SIL3_FRAOC|nr:uncharacterized protein LOC113207032 [Frankliniella occidentalis]KAE8738719.1 hypothetical protein FOCC_FOCC015815 [Frankliniella occidentalis]